MLVGTLIQVVRRRWLVVLAGVLLTGLAAAAVVNLQPPRYTVSATALLLPPKVSSDGTETNPYLQLGGLTTAVDVLARALNDPRVHDQVVKSGETSDFIAERDFLTAAPLLVVTAESTSADRAREIRDDGPRRRTGGSLRATGHRGRACEFASHHGDHRVGRCGRARLQGGPAHGDRGGGGRPRRLPAPRRWSSTPGSSGGRPARTGGRGRARRSERPGRPGRRPGRG